MLAEVRQQLLNQNDRLLWIRQVSCDHYVVATEQVQQEIDQLFLTISLRPLSYDVDSASSELQMELIDLHCRTDLKA